MSLKERLKRNVLASQHVDKLLDTALQPSTSPRRMF